MIGREQEEEPVVTPTEIPETTPTATPENSEVTPAPKPTITPIPDAVPGTQDSSPKTGDDYQVFIWMVAAGVSGLIGIGLLKKKNKVL